MVWKGKKIYWENGVVQVFKVMDNVHQAFNLSDKTMEFLFLDVKMDTEIESRVSNQYTGIMVILNFLVKKYMS